MKKKVLGIMLCGLMLSMAGCGKKQETVDVGEKVAVEENAEENVIEKSNINASSPEALAGVYPDGDELTSIPMGCLIDGEQVDLINIEMPLNYVISALYQNSDLQAEGFENAYGSTLATALELDFQKEPYAINDVYLGAYGESGTSVRYLVVNNMTFDEMKEYAKTEEDFSDYTEKTVNGIDVIYYKDNAVISTDFVMIYPIDNTTFLGVYYNGSFVDELGMDQLAENICNLITVIQ